MISMDIFRGGAAGGAFSALTLTTKVQDLKYTPSLLTGMTGLVSPTPIYTEKFAVERQADTQRLIPVTERGAPRTKQTRDRRNVRDFRTVRTAKTDELRSVELANMRAFGSESALETVQTELMKRYAKLRRDHDLTEEYRLLGMIAGNVLDADGTSVLYNWFTEFGITPPTEIAFNWASKTGVAEFIRSSVIRPILTALQGRAVPGTRIMALCGDSFFDGLTANTEVRQSYLNWQAAQELRGGLAKAYSFFNYGDIEWINYRSATDSNNVTVGVASDKCRFFPVGVPDMFQKIISPNDEDLTFVNTLGLPIYAKQVIDPSGYDSFIELSMDAFNAHVCTTPEALLSGRAGA
jgi:hypothetical protein